MDDLARYAPLITIAVGILTVVGVLIGVGRYTRGLESRLERVEAKMDTLNAWASGFSKETNTFFGVIVQLLSNRRELSTDELALVTGRLSAMALPAVETLFERERLSRNPLTGDELDRLEAYFNRLKAGGLLTPDEVADYNRLVAVLERERPTDPGVWPLVALGAFLTGLTLGQRDRS